MQILVTGATGKVGRNVIERVLSSEAFENARIRALCHNRLLDARPTLEIVQGNISDRAIVRRALDGVTHVLHCATCKEMPDDIIDVAVKGLFWLLEECRSSPSFQQFILIGGDAAVGHFSTRIQSRSRNSRNIALILDVTRYRKSWKR